ncbi:putative leucine-rich melanocyte differentiation-associated protein [Paratrimastix pyriformis]|uniref:Leucine-rich melanocyte differentiation-associated protein n=1 Tax=Paratrimastix pyriformis TaxID=342808 RepID=A0ABQ8UCP9_9EUKA|nr:putative leucine-rich melanocyte differentiation-associated protein [Paratrimastix pyriformis]
MSAPLPPPSESVSLAYRQIREITPDLGRRYGNLAKHLDLSYNQISNCTGLSYFSHLESLIMDGNAITSHTNFPFMPQLHTLSVNKNQIQFLPQFVDKLRACAPKLRHFSMLNNQACPNFFNQGTPREYQDYRKFVIARLENLVMLDSSNVSPQERAEARAMFGNLQIASTGDSLATEARRYQLAASPVAPSPSPK